MGFDVAWDVAKGDEVWVGGRWRTVAEVQHTGVQAPYFRFKSDAPTAFDAAEVACGTSPDWVSWRTVGPQPVRM